MPIYLLNGALVTFKIKNINYRKRPGFSRSFLIAYPNFVGIVKNMNIFT